MTADHPLLDRLAGIAERRAPDRLLRFTDRAAIREAVVEIAALERALEQERASRQALLFGGLALVWVVFVIGIVWWFDLSVFDSYDVLRQKMP